MSERGFSAAVCALHEVVQLSAALGLAIRGEAGGLSETSLSALVGLSDFVNERAVAAKREVDALSSAWLRNRLIERKTTR